MKKFNLALLILAGLLAIADLMEGQVIEQDTSFYRNGTIMQLLTYQNGVQVERLFYYPTGEVKLYQEFDPSLGLQSKSEFWYFRNGQVEHSCDWMNGYAHGYAFWWDEYGNDVRTEVYVEGRLVPTEDFRKYFPDQEEKNNAGGMPESVAHR